MVKGSATRHIHYAHIAKDGEPGKPGASSMPPRLWTDYPDNYNFQDGSGGAGSWLDVVLMPNSKASGEYIAYYCKVSHVKADARKPGDGVSNKWWGMMDGSFLLLATKILLANSANIDLITSNGIRIYDTNGIDMVGLLSSVSGAPTINGKQIVFFIGGNDKNPRHAVTSDGVTYHGGITGQRIEIDPVSKEMRVYDASGALCASHGGAQISPSDIPSGGSSSISGTTQAGAGISSSTQTAIGSATLITRDLRTVTPTLPGTFRVTVPAYNITLRANGDFTGSSPSPTPIPFTRLVLYAQSKINGAVSHTVPLFDSANTNGGTSVSGTTRLVTMNERLEAGQTCTVSVVAACYIYGGNGSGGSITATATAAPAGSFVGELNNHAYQANGFLHSISTEDYFYSLFINGQLKMDARSKGLPLLAPRTLFKGQLALNIDGETGTASAPYHGWATFDGEPPPMKRASNLVSLDLAPWESKIRDVLSLYNLHVSLTPVSTGDMRVPAVRFRADEHVLDMMLIQSDKQLASTGTFLCEITYYPNAPQHKL